MGGGPTSLLATVVAPLWGGHGPMGRLHWPGVATAHCWHPLWLPWEPTQGTLVGSQPNGALAQGPLPPPGGEIHSREASLGEWCIYPPPFP